MTERFYSKQHQWCVINGDTATVGITDHAQKSLTDIVFVELPEIGKQLDQFDELSSIESVKSVSQVFAPVSGEVTEVNTDIEDNPEKINEDPYGEGWLVKIKIKDSSETSNLLSKEKYDETTKETS